MPEDHTSSSSQDSAQRGLANVRALVRWNKETWRPGSLGDDVGRFAKPRSVGVVGAGIMGRAIAAIEVEHGVPVVLVDAMPEVLETAKSLIAAELAEDMTAKGARAAVDELVTTDGRVSSLSTCDMVIESIVESPEKKQALLAELEQQVSKEALLLSNTSTIPIGRLASGLSRPERFCGYHFFHPARHRQLLEIVPGESTSSKTVHAAVAHARTIDKLPIVVNDGPGFQVNRLLLSYMGEALDLLLEGATIEQVEAAAADFGMAFGPLRLLDEIGLDTALHGGWVMGEAFPERTVASPLLVAMIKAGRLGRKTSAGFFSYESDDLHAVAKPAEETRRIIEKWARTPGQHSPESITNRLLLPMLLEATRILEEGRLNDPREVDLGLLFGAGFPHARGGLLFWADEVSPRRIVKMLGPLEYLGQRGQATPMLLDLANNGGRFYAAPNS